MDLEVTELSKLPRPPEGEVAGSAEARRPIARQDAREFRANELQRRLIEPTVSLPVSRPRAAG